MINVELYSNFYFLLLSMNNNNNKAGMHKSCLYLQRFVSHA